MRKKLVVFISIAFIVMLAACGGEKVDDETATKYISKAEEIIHLLNDEDYGAVVDEFADDFKDDSTEGQLREIQPLIEDSGEFKEVKKSSVEKSDGFFVTVIAGKYSEDDRIFTISFNDDDEVVGLFVK